MVGNSDRRRRGRRGGRGISFLLVLLSPLSGNRRVTRGGVPNLLDEGIVKNVKGAGGNSDHHKEVEEIRTGGNGLSETGKVRGNRSSIFDGGRKGGVGTKAQRLAQGTHAAFEYRITGLEQVHPGEQCTNKDNSSGLDANLRVQDPGGFQMKDDPSVGQDEEYAPQDVGSNRCFGGRHRRDEAGAGRREKWKEGEGKGILLIKNRGRQQQNDGEEGRGKKEKI